MKNTKVIAGVIFLSALIVVGLIVVSHRAGQANDEALQKNDAKVASTTGIGITGTMRDEIVTPIVANCTKKLKANPQTADLPVDYVSAWCNCNASELADRMTTQDVADLQSGARAQADILTPKAEAALEVCKEKVKLDVTSAADTGK